MNEKDYKFGHYSIIPDVVLFSEKLSSNEKVLYSVILSLSNKEGYCYATNKYLGNNIKRNSINNNKGSFMNFEQRSYSDEFLESLYIK